MPKEIKLTASPKNSNPAIITDMKQRLSDILMAVSWRELTRSYFGKSCSWMYHKMDGINGVGGVGGFSPEKASQLKSALLDLSEQIRRSAENI